MKAASPVCGRIAEGGSDTILLPDASASTWFVVGEGIWEARECSNLDGRGRPSSAEVFLEMADRSVRTASGAALRRTAGGGCPHMVLLSNWGARRECAVSVPHGECPPGRSCRLKPETKQPRTPSKLLASSNISGPDRGWRNSPIGSTAALVLYSEGLCRGAVPLLPRSHR